MSKFRQLVEKVLQEAKQVGKLYHTTSLSGIIGICNSNSIGSQRYNGISFSRDKYNWYENGPFTIVIDGNKLSNNHKAYPFSFHSYFPNEYPGKDTNAETTILPRGMKPSIRKQDAEGNWSGCDEIFGDQYFELKHLDKYMLGLMINSNNYNEIYDFEINDLKQDNLIPQNLNTKEEIAQFVAQLFKKTYPNAFVEFVNHKQKDRSTQHNWSAAHRKR